MLARLSTFAFASSALAGLAAGAQEISIDNVLVREDVAGGQAVFTVKISAEPATTVKVDYTTVRCTDEGALDLVPIAGQLTFGPGQPLTRNLAVTVLDDKLREGMEAFAVVLSNAQGAMLADDRGEGLIEDDELSPRTSPPASDWNGDLRSDVVVESKLLQSGEPPGRTIVWGVSSNVASIIQTSAGYTVGPWRVVGSGDFDGDALADLLWRSKSAGLSVSSHPVLEGSISPPVQEVYPVPSGWDAAVDVGVGDFDGDGDLDLLVWEGAGRGLVVWQLDGATWESEAPIVPGAPTDRNFEPIATGEFNGDGQPDVLFRNSATGELRAWLIIDNEMVAETGFTPFGVSNLDWTVVAAGDFNGDNSDDLLYQNAISKRLVVWFMAGTVRLCGTYFDPDKLVDPLYPYWSVVAPR